MKYKIVLLFVALTFAIASGEFFCRIVFKEKIRLQRTTQADKFGYRDPSGWVHNIPNAMGSAKSWDGQGRIKVTIDANGFRKSENEKDNQSGFDQKQIAFIGDSIVFGSGVPFDDTFVGRLNRLFRKKSHGQVVVMNAGVQDVGLTEEMNLLRTTVLPLKPELVVLGWYLNDNRPPQGFPDEIILNNPIVNSLNRMSWFHRSYLVQLIYDQVVRYLVQRNLWGINKKDHRMDWYADFKNGNWRVDFHAFQKMQSAARFEWGDAWDQQSQDSMFRKIQEMNQMSKLSGSKFLVVSFPVSAQVETKLEHEFVSWPQSQLQAFCQSNNIPCLDLLPILRNHRDQRLFFDQCHYTPSPGHFVVSEALFPFLQQNLN